MLATGALAATVVLGPRHGVAAALLEHPAAWTVPAAGLTAILVPRAAAAGR